jgi:hypothetical protein
MSACKQFLDAHEASLARIKQGCHRLHVSRALNRCISDRWLICNSTDVLARDCDALLQHTSAAELCSYRVGRFAAVHFTTCRDTSSRLWRIPTSRRVGHFGLHVHFVASPELHGRFKCCPESHSTSAFLSNMPGHVPHLCNLYCHCLSQPLPSSFSVHISHSITRFPAPSLTPPPDSHMFS